MSIENAKKFLDRVNSQKSPTTSSTRTREQKAMDFLYSRGRGLPALDLQELPELTAAPSQYATWTGKKGGVDARGIDLEAGAADLEMRGQSLDVLNDYLEAAGVNLDRLERRASLTGAAEDVSAYESAFETYKAAAERARGEAANYDRLRGIYNAEVERTATPQEQTMPTTKAEAEAYRAQLQSEIEALKAEGRRKSDTASAHGRDSLFEEPRYEYIRANDIAAKEKELADMEAAWYQTAMSEARLSVPEELQQQIGKMASRELGLAEQRELLDAMQAAGYTKREAQEIVEYAQQMKDRAHQIKRSEETVENARERSTFTNWLFGTGAGLASGVGLFDIAEQNIENTLRGENPYTGEKTPVNYNTGAQSAYLRGQDIAEGQELKMVDKFYDRYLPKMGDEEKAKAAAEEKAAARMNAFNLATSMGQSGAVAGLTAMGVPAAMLLLSGSAGTATAQEYHEKGYSDSAALGMGLLAAGAEYVTEKVSIDSLFKMSDAKSVRAVVGNVLTQMLTEGSEEVSSSLINAVGDAFVSALAGKESEFKQRFDYYRERSTSDKEAFTRAMGEWVKELGADFLGGAISGGLFGLGGTAILGARTATADTRRGKAIQNAGQAETVQELYKGLTQSERWQQRIKAAEINAENARELGKAARQIDAVSMDRAITERLRALGDHTTQGDVVAAIRAEATGQRLTAGERAALKRSRYGARVAEEFKAAMEGESTDGNRWAAEAMEESRAYYERLLTRSQANKVVDDPAMKAEFEEKTGVTLEGAYGDQARTVMAESQKKLDEMDGVGVAENAMTTEEPASVSETETVEERTSDARPYESEGRDGFDEARKTLEKENVVTVQRDGADIKIGVQESRRGGYTAAAYVNNGPPIAAAGETRREAVEEVIRAVKEELKNGQSVDAGQGNRADGIGAGGEAGAVSFGIEGENSGTGSEAGSGVGAAEKEDLRKVSHAELGIRNGGKKKTIELVDVATLEGEAKAAAERVRSEGLEPVAIRGQIAVGKGEANAYIQGTKIYFSVDAKDAAGKPISPEKLVKHEIYHNQVRQVRGLLQEGRKAVRQSMSAERFDKMKKAYLDAYSKIQDFTDWTAEEIAEYLEEEICADAIAGINYFSGSTELTAKLEKLTEQMSATEVEVEAQQDTTGPPEGRGAIDVENADITLESTEEERYEVLKDKTITPAKVNLSKLSGEDIAAAEQASTNTAKGIFRTIAGKLGLNKINLENSTLEFPFVLSKTNAGVSGWHQKDYGGSYLDLAKALTCLDELAENAVLIETHKEKKTGTSRENVDLKQVYVFLSAMQDGNHIVPVELEVKEFYKNDAGLYLAVALTNIEASRVNENADTQKNGAAASLFQEASTISIQKLLENVNVEDGRFLKYAPDGFLNEEQKKSKQEALARQQREYASYDKNEPSNASVSIVADIDVGDTENYGEIDSSIRVPGRREKREATRIAVTEGYPSLLNDEGEAVTAIPGWTWVRANDRGNYGVVVGKDGNMLEVFFSNKEQNVGRYVKMLPRELTAVEAQYSDPAAADRPLGEPPAWMDEEDLTDPMTDEEFEQMMQEADDKESGRIRLAEELIGEGEVNTAEEDPGSIPEVKQLLEEDADLRYADLDINPEDYAFVARIQPGKGGNYNKTAEQNMDDAAGKDKALRKELQEKIVAPVRRAVDAYNKAVNKDLRELHDKMKELGIKKGSRENLAIVWYGEGIKQGKGSGLPPEATEEYDLAKLQAEFPQTWEKVVEAEKYFRQRYDTMLQQQNAAREEIYPKVVERAQEDIRKYNTIADEIEARATKTVFKLQSVRQSIRKAEARLDAARTDNARERAVAQLERLRAQEAKLEAQDDRYRQRAARTRSVAVNIQRKIDSGEILKNKFIRPRKDYFHHGREMATGLEGLFNTLTASADIDSGLAGMSEFTKPKAKWQGHFQQRSNAIYNADAIGDMQKYIQAAEYVIHIDKATARLRKQIQVMAELTQKDRNANKMLTWMADWTGQITGKTNPMDRFLTTKLMGRKALKVLKWINGRVKSNAIMMNPRSAIAQFYNLPVAAMHVKNPADWQAGAGMLVDAMSGEGSARHAMSQSGFLTARFEIDKAEENLDGSKLKDIKKFSAWMMRAGDEAVAKLTWCAAYEQGLRENVADPIAHADDITRRSVAGRGIGEVPLVQDSEITKLVAPFQVEVNNLWQVMKSKVKEKDLGAVALFALISWIMNAGARELFGSDVSWDPINAAVEAVESIDEDDNAWDKTWKIIGRMAGETISNMPYGGPAAQYLISDDTKREALFGDADPTRYGTGNIGLNMLTAPLLSLINGDEVTEDLVSAILNVGLPSGGKEAVRILDTLQLYGIVPEVSYSTDEGWSVYRQEGGGASYTDGGALRFATDPTFANIVQSMLFGEFATKEGKAYLESGGSPRGENTTALFQKLTQEGLGTTEAMEAITEMSALKGVKRNGKTVAGSRNVRMLEWLEASGFSDRAQSMLYKELIDSDAQLEKIEAMESAGMGWGDISDTLMEYYETGFNGELTANEKASSFAAWAMENLSEDQAQLVRDEFTYSSGFVAKTDKYDAFVEAGITPAAASDLLLAINSLTPDPGKAQVSDAQRLYLISSQKLSEEQKYGAAGTYMDTDPGESQYSQFEKMEIAREAGMDYLSWVDMRSAEDYLEKARIVTESGIDEDAQLDVMETFLTDSQFFKLETATGYGVTPELWTRFKRMLPEYDANDNENYAQAEVQECINAIGGISDEERAILWQMQTGGKTNPFDRELGREFKSFYDAWNEQQKAAKKAEKEANKK